MATADQWMAATGMKWSMLGASWIQQNRLKTCQNKQDSFERIVLLHEKVSRNWLYQCGYSVKKRPQVWDNEKFKNRLFINSGGWAAGTRYKHVNTDEFTHICTIFNIWDVFRALPATVTQKSKCCTETKYFQSSEPTHQENV